ncbi:glycine cleavage system protein R [Microbacterium gorillae]|uniref:glycine cleavage system protein R n=1 Tax=Microbacterium gorillae TaxID=1231063 RepID=UPI00058C7B81|nr:ACT domain-containing protein [Microbacterium gorillae]
MTTLVLTVIGDDRSGLVTQLSDIIATHGGNWTTSSMARLAGKFAGIVEVDIAEDRADGLQEALEPLAGLLEITAHRGAVGTESGTHVRLDFVGDDRAGIVHDITAIVHRCGGSIESLSSEISEAPMSGGELFTAHAVIRVPDSEAARTLRAELEGIADELMVDLTFGA